jgi:integrase
MRLTEASIRGITLPAGKTDHVEWDDLVPGFGVRVRQTGSRTFVFQYRVGTQTRRMSLGRVGAIDSGRARAAAKELYARRALGQDPAGERKESRGRAGDTFAACVRLYLTRRHSEGRLRISTHREVERHLVRNLKALHPLHIEKVDRRAIAVELAQLAERAPVQGNRTRASLVRFLGWCAREGYIDTNPAMFTNKNAERPRSRVLDDIELRKLWHALPASDFGDVIKLLILTGSRANEIARLRWSEVDLERGVISLAGARTKNRHSHVIPMSPTARAILGARSQKDGRDLIFGRGPTGYNGWSRNKQKLDAQLNISPWIIHDLRRVVSTGMNELGISPWVVEACLNHLSGARAGVAGRYNHSSLSAEKAAALARWDERLTAIVGGAK